MKKGENLIYKESLALFTDLYELTMAYGYWKMGMHDQEAIFYLSFRKWPFKGGFAIAAGLKPLIDYILDFDFTESDISYLSSLKDNANQPLFETAFLKYLSEMELKCDIDAVEEGTLVFPYEPIIRVRGPILQAQILESVILNIINFQTLIATKSARVSLAASGDQVVEFGMRRAQGIDGAISASRASFIGGCESTSHVLAGKLFDIPVRGTMAHSWVMAFDDELKAFMSFAEVMPHNCIFLIDTYDSLEGTRNAIKAVRGMAKKDFSLLGVRLDSGDLTHLSVEVRKILDQEGYTDAKIMASNELDEYLIGDMKNQGSKVTIWGVGTNLVTSKDQSALDGVYKLSGIQEKGGKWVDRIKISEQTAKVTLPGHLQVRRFYKDGKYVADAIYDEREELDPHLTKVLDENDKREISGNIESKDLLIPIFQKGELVYKFPHLKEIQKRAKEELTMLDTRMKRFINPEPYFVGLDKNLYAKRKSLIESMRQK